jgi:NADH-quinone oxidoreductase subunit A
MFGFWEMLIYIGIVLVGFWYVWKKGVLDWALRGYRGEA